MAFPAGKSIFHFPEKNLVPQFFITNNMGHQKKSKIKTQAELHKHLDYKGKERFLGTTKVKKYIL